MPSIKEKLKFEERNERTVRLWPEGAFYKAYERSAYLFVSQVRSYEVRRLFVKSIGQDVMSIGFPQTVLTSLDMPHEKSADGAVVLQLSTPLDEQQFLLWRDAQAAPIPNQTSEIKKEHADIADRIRRFNLATATPMQCMLFLSELQQILNDDAGLV